MCLQDFGRRSDETAQPSQIRPRKQPNLPTSRGTRENRSARNAGAGILLDSHSAPGNLVQQNLVFGNGTQGIALTSADGNTLKQNEVLGNVADGVRVDANSENTVLDGNIVSGNTSDGIDVDDTDGGTLIKKNTADGNADRGIEAASGIDGGGNKAGGNVNMTQCQVVVCS